jgi:hypothetical protein
LSGPLRVAAPRARYRCARRQCDFPKARPFRRIEIGPHRHHRRRAAAG